MKSKIPKKENKNKINQIKKQLRLKCVDCQALYELVEKHYLTKLNANSNCLENCLVKWKDILAEHYQHELTNYLNEKDDEE